MRWALPVFIQITFIVGCAHYRSNVGAYRGLGSFKVASDYGQETIDREPAYSNLQYAPQKPFRLIWPVDQINLSQGFKTFPRHEGIDLTGPKGTMIRAAHEGLVIYTGEDFNGYGKMVLLEYDSQWATLYGHLDKISVREGEIVHAGQQIGSMGDSGRSTGVHLHFEVMNQRQPIDPVPLLNNANK